jgi:hypothetical protein
MGYEAQLVIAVINANAPIKGRLKPTFTGEGQSRQCAVSATFQAESEPCEYVSPKISDIPTKNSPLWKADPDQQLFYYSARAWARRYCPEIVMGVYTVDELADAENLGTLPSQPAEYGAESAGFLRGKAKNEAVAVMTAALDSCDTVEALESRWETDAPQRKRISQNAAYGLEEVFEQRKHALAQSKADADDVVVAVLNETQPPAAPASPFETLKAQGLAIVQSEPEGRDALLNDWAQALSVDALDLCSEAERDELRSLYRNIRAEVRG